MNEETGAEPDVPDEPPAQTFDPSAEVHPVAVASLPWEEAWLLAGRLDADGIPARVFPDWAAGPISSAQFLPVGKEMVGRAGLGRSHFDVLVPEEFAEEARAIVRRYAHR